ncbi:MAG: hypothetical protein IJM42_04915 [Synergistes sp.]|nr:hypothetical protein [Synergistes sp.]
MELLHAGLDIGSATKAVVHDEHDKILFCSYARHFADIRASVERLAAAIHGSKKPGD